MFRNGLLRLIVISATAAVVSSCQSSSDDGGGATAAPKKLYVASGLCYSGSGITTYAAAAPQPSRSVTRWDSSTGQYIDKIIDLNFGNNVSVNTFPQDIIDKGDHILLLTENATTTGDRKIWKIFKDNPSTFITYATDPTAFTNTAGHILRSMAQDVDGSIVFSKSLFMEKVNTGGVRIVKGGGNPWVNSAGAAAPCFTAAAGLITDSAILTPFTNTNQGKIAYLHGGGTNVTNRIGFISRTGMTSTTAADCAGGVQIQGTAHTNAPNLVGPVTIQANGASPTSMVLIPTPSPATTTYKMIVTYSGATGVFDNNTNFNYGIVMWDVTETSDTAVTINNPVILYRDESVLWAASAMTYDATTGHLFVAVGGSPLLTNQTTQTFGYNIEKFSLDINTPLVTRITGSNATPFIVGNADTKCISSLVLAD